MIKSESIVKLADALVKAQAEMPAAKMDADNPFYHSRYATLGSVIEISKPILAKYGLAVSQPIVYDGDRVGVETILMHSSGEYISNICCVRIEPFSPDVNKEGKIVTQKPVVLSGVTITYLRRYALASILGIYSDEDTDGNDSKKKPADKAEPTEKKITHDAPWSPEFLREQIAKKIAKHPAAVVEQEQINRAAAMISNPFQGTGTDAKAVEGIRHSIVKYLIGQPLLREAKGAEILVLLDWLKSTQDSGGLWTPCKIAALECQAIWKQVQLEAGQLELKGD
jgi:hypothetical protein